jgi:hypothetical protein
VRLFRSDDTMKVCRKCGQSKLLREFHYHPSMKDGHLNKCKSCRKEDDRRRVELRKE